MSEINYDKIWYIADKINNQIKKIVSIFPDDKDKDHLLKNLAYCITHLALFTKDLCFYQEFDSIEKDEEFKKIENKFFKECGCNKQVKEKNN